MTFKQVFLKLLSSTLILSNFSQPAVADGVQITEVVGNGVSHANETVRLKGSGLTGVQQIFVDELEASFYVNSDSLVTVRIPMDVSPGDVTVLLRGAISRVEYKNLFEVVANELPKDSKVSIGAFLGYVAVYTRGLEGSRLSIQIGGRWRQVGTIAADFSKNLTRVGENKLVSVRVYVNGELVKVQQVISS